MTLNDSVFHLRPKTKQKNIPLEYQRRELCVGVTMGPGCKKLSELTNPPLVNKAVSPAHAHIDHLP